MEIPSPASQSLPRPSSKPTRPKKRDDRANTIAKGALAFVDPLTDRSSLRFLNGKPIRIPCVLHQLQPSIPQPPSDETQDRPNEHTEWVKHFVEQPKGVAASVPLDSTLLDKIATFIDSNGASFDKENPCSYQIGTTPHPYDSVREMFGAFVESLGKNRPEGANEILGLLDLAIFEGMLTSFYKKYGVTRQDNNSCAIGETCSLVLKGTTPKGIFQQVVETLKGLQPDDEETIAKEAAPILEILAQGVAYTTLHRFTLTLPEGETSWPTEWEGQLINFADWLEDNSGIDISWNVDSSSKQHLQVEITLDYPADWTGEVAKATDSPTPAVGYKELLQALLILFTQVSQEATKVFPEAKESWEKEGKPLLAQFGAPPPKPEGEGATQWKPIAAVIAVVALAALAIYVRHTYFSPTPTTLTP